MLLAISSHKKEFFLQSNKIPLQTFKINLQCQIQHRAECRESSVFLRLDGIFLQTPCGACICSLPETFGPTSVRKKALRLCVDTLIIRLIGCSLLRVQMIFVPWRVGWNAQTGQTTLPADLSLWPDLSAPMEAGGVQKKGRRGVRARPAFFV